MVLNQTELLDGMYGYYGNTVTFVSTEATPEQNTYGYYGEVPWFHVAGAAPPPSPAPFFVQCVVFT